MEYFSRIIDGKYVATIEDGNGKVVDSKPCGSGDDGKRAVMALREQAATEDVKSFADIGKKKAAAAVPAKAKPKAKAPAKRK